MEPKVILPFESRPGQTPRKIEIERRKRLFASQKIEDLIAKELYNMRREYSTTPALTSAVTSAASSSDSAPISTPIISRKIENDISRLLPLSSFDDTEFEQRTIQEWLDMNANLPPSSKSATISSARGGKNNVQNFQITNNKRIVQATIPVPAKAIQKTQIPKLELNAPSMESLAGVEGTLTSWKDCLVTAYDFQENKWKVRWIKYNGWELDNRKEEGEEDLESDEEEESKIEGEEDEPDENEIPPELVGKPQEEIDLYCRKNEAWVERYDNLNIYILLIYI